MPDNPRQMELDIIFEVFHKVRLHISSIKDYASILANKDLGEANKEQIERLNKISELCNFSNSLIKDSLLVLELGSETIAKTSEQLSIAQIIEQSVSVIITSAQHKQLKIEIKALDELPQFWGERENILEAVINILNNAVKFNNSGGTITIDALVRPDEYMQVNISDTGIGIDPRALPKIFEPFYCQEEDSSNKGGGLGLSIVRQIIEHHKGEIWVKSKLGQGSKFSFTLPIDVRKLERKSLENS